MKTSPPFQEWAHSKWAGRRSNPRIRLFRPALHRLSYRPNEKGRAFGMTPGLAATCAHEPSVIRPDLYAAPVHCPVRRRTGSASLVNNNSTKGRTLSSLRSRFSRVLFARTFTRRNEYQISSGNFAILFRTRLVTRPVHVG